MAETVWDRRKYHGRYNRYPFTEVVSFVMSRFGGVPDRGAVRILDLGCGGGHHVSFLAAEGFDFHGVDGSTEAVEIARARLESEGYPTDTIQLATFDTLPYDDDGFDAVIDRGSLTCNPRDDIPPLVGEIRRVLKPGGLLFSVMLHAASTVKDRAVALGNNDYQDLPGRLKEAGVLHFAEADEAERLFAGLRVHKIETIRHETVHGDAGDDAVTAWMATTCLK